MKHNFLSIGEVFDRYKKIYVPYYQRDYVWGNKNDGRNLYKFIDDIFTQYDKNPNDYFIGTLAFCSDTINDIIDGQQRITSMVLILSILADLKCSQDIKEKNKKLINTGNDFIIQESHYLSEELKSVLGIEHNFKSQGHKVDLSKTKDKIKKQIEMAWGEKEEKWYDGLYSFMLEKVKCIVLEYSNIGDSIKYFLNINSLSVQLTQSDIFYSIFSQSLRISKNTKDIFDIKKQIKELSIEKGIQNDIFEYKNMYEEDDKGINNIIYLFLNAKYQGHKDISYLKETGIGKWISFYLNEIFIEESKAKEFVDSFLDYIKDFKIIHKLLTHYEEKPEESSSLYTSWVLLQYENYKDYLNILQILLKTRHSYIQNKHNLYIENTKEIDKNKLNEVCRRLSVTLLRNYIKNSKDRISGFTTNIELNSDGVYKKSIEDIIGDIIFDDIMGLTYGDKNYVSNSKIADNSRIIKVIFACQEAFLNTTVMPSRDINGYLKEILISDSFSVEHLYSKNEWHDKERLKNWREKKNKFTDENGADFDTERFKFENLSLLNKKSNSTASDKTIHDKLDIYKTARGVNGSEPEYLIQSLVENSDFYKDPDIANLKLPNRIITNIEQNTWEINSQNNRKFNIDLIKLAVNRIIKK